MQEAREHYEALRTEIQALGARLDEQGFPGISLASVAEGSPGPADD